MRSLSATFSPILPRPRTPNCTKPGRQRPIRVRSFVPTENRWVQYTLSSGGHRPVRWEGTEAADNRAVMVTGMVAAEPGQEPTMRRVEWRLEGDRLIRTTAFSTGDETWRPLSEASLRAR